MPRQRHQPLTSDGHGVVVVVVVDVVVLVEVVEVVVVGTKVYRRPFVK